MNRWTRGLVIGVAALATAGAAHAQKEPKKEKGVYRATRAGWMMGMYVGEAQGSFYPVVFQVDPKSDAAFKGIKAGDELYKFDGLETNPLWRIFDKANSYRPHKEVVIWVRRGAETRRFWVRVPKEPGAAPAETAEEKPAKEKDGESAEGEGDKKKKSKKKPPVVIKPLPSDNPQ